MLLPQRVTLRASLSDDGGARRRSEMVERVTLAELCERGRKLKQETMSALNFII